VEILGGSTTDVQPTLRIGVGKDSKNPIHNSAILGACLDSSIAKDCLSKRRFLFLYQTFTLRQAQSKKLLN
jgi:hypothetical protein